MGETMRATILAGQWMILLSIAFVLGCASPHRFANPASHPIEQPACCSDLQQGITTTAGNAVVPVVFENGGADESTDAVQVENLADEDTAEWIEGSLPEPGRDPFDLQSLIDTAMNQHPGLNKLYRSYLAATARVRYVDKLPDPKLGANVFGNPIETAAGSQRATLSLSQTIPWLGRLDAQQKRACLEALALRAEYRAERLNVVAGIRVGWTKLYVIDQQIEITRANQQLLNSLMDVANSRIAAGAASQGDVLLASLELSRIEKQLISYRRQRRAVVAELNRLVGRSAETPIKSPREIQRGLIDLDVVEIQRIAAGTQPEMEAARLRRMASRWGIEIARLSRRPDLTLSANYFFTDSNRPPTTVVDVGEDPFAIGFQVSLPVWQRKYDALSNEAGWKHQAAHANEEEIQQRYEALIESLVAEANRAAETATLYESTILPQARQTLSADQDSYSTGAVEFDRVIRDYRSVLSMQLAYHQAIGELGIANAQIQRAAGTDLSITSWE